MERSPNPSRLQRLCTLVLCKWAHRVFFNKCKKGNEEQVMNWQTVFFLPVCVSGNFAMMKKLKQFLKASLKNERTRKERSLSVFLLDKSYRANMIWTADSKSGKMVTPLHIIFGKHGHLSEHGCNILFNMFPYVSNVCYSGLTKLCKLYLLLGRKDYERILNVIKI